MFREIEFHERWRGYDPDEVDAYVNRVARSAAALRGRLSELHERVEAAEARSSGGGGVSEAEETLTRTLVLAQRTADAAIAEAREEADRMTADAATSAQAILSAAEAEAQVTLREAQSEASATTKESEDRAAVVLAEAETDRRTIVAEAESLAAEAASAERERLATEAAELQEYRAFLADDIEILERHLAEERHRLSAALSALTGLLEAPEAFRAMPPPATSGVEIDPDLHYVAADEPVTVEADPVEGEEGEDVESTAPFVVAEVGPELFDEADFAPVFEPAPEPAADPEQMIDPNVVEEPTPPDDIVETGIDPGTPAEPSPIDTPYFDGGAAEVPDAAGDLVTDAPPRLVTVADFEPSSPAGAPLGFDDAGPSTAPVPTIAETSLFAEPSDTADDPFLAQLRDAVESEPVEETDDDALSAFFDQEDDDGGRSWFGRRR